MWHDVRRGDDDQDADLDAELRSPEYASPQSSGDERDAFLRRSRDVPQVVRDTAPTTRFVDVPRSSHDSSSPVGVALASGSKASAPSLGQRHIIPRKQLAEVSFPEDAEPGPDSPLLQPPAANLDISHGSRRSLLPSERSMTPGNDPESALLYTAQRVQVSTSTHSSPGTTWAEGIGMPSILRRSWLNPMRRSGTTTTASPKSSFVGRQLTDSELEAGRNLRSELGYREAVRPVSGLSMMSSGSGNTVFYDAQSREDLASTPSPVPPLAQGTASAGRNGPSGPSPLSAEPLRPASEADEPSVYEPSQPDIRQPDDDVVDYLDIPAPPPASPFAPLSSTNRLSSPTGLDFFDSDPAALPSLDISDAIDTELLDPTYFSAKLIQMLRRHWPNIQNMHDLREAKAAGMQGVIVVDLRWKYFEPYGDRTYKIDIDLYFFDASMTPVSKMNGHGEYTLPMITTDGRVQKTTDAALAQVDAKITTLVH